MSQEITEELLLFFHSFLTGIIMAVFYDGLLIIRRVIRHGQFWISLEDFFFWLISAWGVFLFLVEENNGILRWFAVGGAILGAFLYKKTVSKCYINIMSTIGKSILHILYLVVQKIMTPINAGKACIYRKSKRLEHRNIKLLRSLKKRLTVGIKSVSYTHLDVYKRQAQEDTIPICQDTGMAVVFLEIGQDVHFEGGSLTDAINEGVRQGYVDGYLRKSVVKDPLIRENTKDNTPAVIHYDIVPDRKSVV